MKSSKRTMRRSLVALTGLLVLSVTALPGLAQAGPLAGQTVGVTAYPVKQDQKKRGGAGISVGVDTQYQGSFPFTGKATRTVIDFDNDFVFNPGKKAACTQAALAGTTSEQALANCGAARVGSGNATLAGPLAGVTAIVTAFNGVREAGLPVIYLHSRVGQLNSTAILKGVVRPSGVSGFGQSLDVTVPVLDGGFVITHFDTTVPKQVTKTKKKVTRNKKTGKKKTKKIRTFYVSARCDRKFQNWNFRATSTYDNAQTTVATSSQRCKAQKKKKKKKKK